MQHVKFAYQDYFGINNYFAIQPDGSYLKVALLIDDTIATILMGNNYTEPEVWAPITRDEFIAAYERAQKCINESFTKSCGFKTKNVERLVSADEGEE